MHITDSEMEFRLNRRPFTILIEIYVEQRIVPYAMATR